jgi:hypothetical protein
MRRIGERRKPANTSGVKAFFRRTPITSHKTATLDTFNAEVFSKHLSRTTRGREMDRRRHGEAGTPGGQRGRERSDFPDTPIQLANFGEATV